MDEKALELIKAIDYDFWKECVETISEEGGSMTVAMVSDALLEIWEKGYDQGYEDAKNGS